jgi:hypothetical protein
MPQLTTRLRLPAPCAESWDAMTPTSTGRHCAACQQTVVDFTLKTDAEILAYFGPGSSGTCGRFRASQLERPLQPAAPASPAPRWRGWLAAALAMWSLRAAATGAPLVAPASPSAQHPRRTATPAPPTRQVAGRLVRGVVRAADGLAPLAQARVRLKGTHRTATTDAQGHFRLWVPARRGPHTQQLLVVQLAGFMAKPVRVPLAARAARLMHINLVSDAGEVPAPMEEQILGGAPMSVVEEVVADSPPSPGRAGGGDTLATPAQPSHLTFYQRLTQPFRRKSSSR